MKGISYKDAGVDIPKGDEVAAKAGQVAANTPHRDYILKGIGDFAAALKVPREGDIVVSTDGVGTKVLLGIEQNRIRGLGIDLVAMCANDILCLGARPLGFLDYMAWGELSKEMAFELLEGIAEGCIQADMPLVGGETAELPGLYSKGYFDLAGFVIGWRPKDLEIGSSLVRPGDVLIGITSTGLHSNGYSLARRVIELNNLDLDHVYEGFEQPLGEVLLRPTAIYTRPVLALLDEYPGQIHAMAHITGGGIQGNLSRVIPEGLSAKVEKTKIPDQKIFAFLSSFVVSEEELFRVFNMGIGLILVVARDTSEPVLEALRSHLKYQDFLSGLSAVVLGEVREGTPKVVIS